MFSCDSKLVEIKPSVEACRPPVTLTRQRRADSKTSLTSVLNNEAGAILVDQLLSLVDVHRPIQAKTSVAAAST